MLTLYYCQTSYASHKVRLYLAEKQLPFKPIHIDLRKQEHITSDYRKINPNGTIPSLIDNDGTIFINSTDIMEHLEKEYPTPPLLPSSTEDRALVHQICIAHEKLHDPSIRLLSYVNVFMQSITDPDEVKKLQALAANHPNPARGEFLRRAAAHDFTDTEIQTAKDAIHDALSQMNQWLDISGGHFMVGDYYTIADAVCTASAYRITKVGLADTITSFPLVSAWYDQMQQRPSFKASLERPKNDQ